MKLFIREQIQNLLTYHGLKKVTRTIGKIIVLLKTQCKEKFIRE